MSQEILGHLEKMTRMISWSGFRIGVKPFRFIGNYRCLDFVNTKAGKSEEIVDLLRSYEDLVTWLGSAGLFERRKLNRLLKDWKGRNSGEAIFKAALRFRDVLDEMAGQIAARREVPKSTLQAINLFISTPSGRTRLVKTPQGFARCFDPDLNEPTQLLVPIAQSAADLLCGGDCSRVKQCLNPDCGAFFYDTSKNRGRRWCTGKTCGNRMRVLAFYKRQKASRLAAR
jgi:predicted RNA-binding Zn ribbon-like protein